MFSEYQKLANFTLQVYALSNAFRFTLSVPIHKDCISCAYLESFPRCVQ